MIPADDIVRPADLKTRAALRLLPLAVALRRILPRSAPIKLGYDAAREVLADPARHPVPYRDQLALVLRGEPFVLGIDDADDHRRRTEALRRMLGPRFLARLARQVDRNAARWLAECARDCSTPWLTGTHGCLDAVAYLRDVARVAFCRTAGLSDPPSMPLDWLTMRLFEHVFLGTSAPGEIRAAAACLAAHVDLCIERARTIPGRGTILSRALLMQKKGQPFSTDADILAALAGLLVGGLPQLAWAGAQALAQLLDRPAALRAAVRAAHARDDTALFALLREALRFDPLAPSVKRRASPTSAASVHVLIATAMHDPRRISEPRRFDAGRDPASYLHFGDGLHRCFGEQIARTVLTRSLAPLLRLPNLWAAVPYRKRGPFAWSLLLRYELTGRTPIGRMATSAPSGNTDRTVGDA